MLALRLPLAIVFIALQRIARRIHARHGIERSAVFLKARGQGEALIKAGNQALLELGARTAAQPTWDHYLGQVPRLLYLPLLIAYWT